MEIKKFVLVHGLCHGACCWYKVKTQLEAAGHCVTAVDLAASGRNMTRVEEIQTLMDYSKPLLEFLSSLGPDDDKVILVAHSMNGISAALAADIFPFKIAAVVFVTAFMPDTRNPPAYVFEKMISSLPREAWLDTVFGRYGKPDCPLESALLGPKFLKTVYQLSPVEDLVLAKMLVRVNPWVTNNLAGTRSFTEEGYGSVTRIYIICGEDNIVSAEYQKWMIKNFPPKEVVEIKDADHMAMFSKPKELCALLLEIADKYAYKPETTVTANKTFKSTNEGSQEEWLDTVFGTYGIPDRPLEFALFGPKFMAKILYQLSPVQDLELAKMLVRVNPLVTNNLAGTRSFREEGYGSVTRIYIICGEDIAVPEDYQRWMIKNFPPKEIMEIKDADHMAMFSKPQDLCALLLEIADKYA